ncbi:MAG: hypothetical protein H6R15_1968 [Proteobacteria bacterium]|nr:hypothetical protein [Pseudomonadota bacterium]
MNAPQRKFLTVAIGLALAAGNAGAALERMGPVSRAPTIGGYPAWFQDKSGITMEFCDLKSQAELDGGWCTLIPPGLSYPENFFNPGQFFDEHFYFAADNGLSDPSVAGGFRARLVIAVEAAFASGPVIDGDQMTFGRHRVFIPRLPYDGDYRIITPFTDITYFDQKAGERIFETSDVGIACINTFECTLGTVIGPYLLPSPTAGGAEVPPMPDLQTAPAGTDPFYDLLVSAGVPTPDPGTGKKYIADPARIGPVTGSPLPNFTDSNGNSRNHNTFRIEVKAPDPAHNGPVIYAIEGQDNFVLSGRLMTTAIPGKAAVERASYKADAVGNVTDLDVFASAFPTTQARLPTQLPAAPAIPILSFYSMPCGGAVSTDPLSGSMIVNPPPYTAPFGAASPMAQTDSDYWGQSQPGGTPPTHVCVEDATARNAAGQVVPAYYLKNVTDDVTVSLASFDGPVNGTLTVHAVSSDPTAILTLAGYGPAAPGSPGMADGKGAGTGLVLAGNVATVATLSAPPARAQVFSSKGGSALQPVITTTGAAVLVGIPAAVNDSATINEDCSPTAALACVVGQGVVVDLLANDTVQLNGAIANLRTLADATPGSVTVTPLAPRFGSASLANGVLTYVPNPNSNGTDSMTYTVTVNGQVSNPAAVSINVTPVNDAPVAVNNSSGAVLARSNNFNLIAKATDPDGNGDVRDAVITSWPAALGAQPVPVNGAISYTPSAIGNFNFSYQVKDASNLLSTNVATGTVTVIGSESITFSKSIFIGAGKIGGVASTRWTVTGADTVKQGQTLSVVYNDGTLVSGGSCNGTASNPSCVIGTAVVDVNGNYALDRVGTPGGPLDPNDTKTWSLKPRSIRVFSSSPVLGGSSSIGIQFK